MTGRPRRYKDVNDGEEWTVRAEEGDETVEELADEAAKAKQELKESTETGKKVQESKDSGTPH